MKNKFTSLTAFLLSATILLSACESNNKTELKTSIITTSDTTALEINNSKSNDASSVATEPSMQTTTTVPVTDNEIYSDELVVHFIDVDQGDSMFIELPNGETMLIDAGETNQADKVVTYIHTQGYDTLDYVVATHAHSDHIGGLPNVLNNFNIENFYITSSVATTYIYEDLLNAVTDSGASVHNVMAGNAIIDEANLLVEVVAPKEIDTEEENNNSIVIKLTYGEDKFLFTGDAEKYEEDGIWTNIKCDVLKVGHHGSDTSSSSNFLKKVEPSYAVICCGLNNFYGHQTEEVLKRLYDRHINIYRTDLQGTIMFTSDGSSISVNVNPFEYSPPVVTTATTIQREQYESFDENVTTYVLNTNSKKIHYMDCSSVDSMKESNKSFTNDYDQAISDGYSPCGRCNP